MIRVWIVWIILDSFLLQVWNPTTFLDQFSVASLYLFTAIQLVKPPHKTLWLKAIAL